MSYIAGGFLEGSSLMGCIRACDGASCKAPDPASTLSNRTKTSPPIVWSGILCVMLCGRACFLLGKELRCKHVRVSLSMRDSFVLLAH